MLHGIPQAVLGQAEQLGIPARVWMMSDQSDDFRDWKLVQDAVHFGPQGNVLPTTEESGKKVLDGTGVANRRGGPAAGQ